MCASARMAFAQYAPNTTPGSPGYQGYPNNGQQQSFIRNDTARTQHKQTDDQLIDTIRKHEEHARDSVIFNSKFIKTTNERLLNDSTQIFAVDTGLTNFENYSVLNQPKTPKISLGYLGTAERSLLFDPSKTIGFDVGLHTLDAYLLNPQDIQYYKARVPFTVLYFVTKDQVFKVFHTQNVNPRLNVGFNLNFIGARGFYSYNDPIGQNVSDINAAVFTWYESKNKRYNLLANLTYNNLKAPETGSILNDTIFTSARGSFDKTSEPVRLQNSYENWKSTGIYIKQFYYIGHIDSLKKGKTASNILPTQRVAYTLFYNTRSYNYLENGTDTYHVFPDYYFASNRSRDSLSVTHLQNDFSYSFYLRGKSNKYVKNEFKLDLGLTQDIYHYSQYVSDSIPNQNGVNVRQMTRMQYNTFQDITLKGKMSYRFSDKAGLEGNINQIAAGRDFGDFIYDAKLLLSGGNKAGRIILDGYTQSSTPGLVYTDWISNHYIFHDSFKNQKTTSLSFNYINDDLQIDLKAEYFLISDYLYFNAPLGGNDAQPAQLGNDINLLKVSLGKNLTWWNKWHFDNFIVYEKTDYQSTLRVPEVYTYSSLYYNTFLFGVLHTTTGMNVRFNTPYVAPSYAVGLGQFYNGPNITFSSYPVATVFIKATLQKTNIFLQYDYVNQGLFSKGYYTVNRYPQQDRILKFGVSWMFFN